MSRLSVDGGDHDRIAHAPRRIARRELLALGLGATALCLVDACARPVIASPGESPAPPSAVPRVLAPVTVTAATTPRPLPVPGSAAQPPRRPAWPLGVLRRPLRSVATTRSQVALTFDDGWQARDDLLRVLMQRRVQCTFFLTGDAIRGDHAFISRALDAGCEIGNHAMTHSRLTGLDAEAVRAELQGLERMVQTVVPDASTVPYMRPPYGLLDSTVIDVASDLGYRPILWSGGLLDWVRTTTPEQMVANATLYSAPGAILLAHFTKRTAAVLGDVLEAIQTKGLEVVTLTELLSPPDLPGDLRLALAKSAAAR